MFSVVDCFLWQYNLPLCSCCFILKFSWLVWCTFPGINLFTRLLTLSATNIAYVVHVGGEKYEKSSQFTPSCFCVPLIHVCYVLYSSMYKMVRSLYMCPQTEMLALLLTGRWLTRLQGAFIVYTLTHTRMRQEFMTKVTGYIMRCGLTNRTPLDYGCKTLSMKRETLNVFFTVRTERLPL